MPDLVLTATSEATCLCCGAPPAPCPCALLVPSLGLDPFATLADAVAAVADFVSNCIGFVMLEGTLMTPPALSSFTADDSTADEVTLDGIMAVDETDSPTLIMLADVALAATSTLTVTWSVTLANRGDVTVSILDCNAGTIVTSQTDSDTGSSSGSFTFADLPAGEYVLACSASWAEGNTSDEASFTAACSDTMFANRVIAQIDPAAGILNNELRACPVMDYVGAQPNLTYAEDWMAALVANCLAAIDAVAIVGFTIGPFTADDSTPNELDIALEQSTPLASAPVVCSLNLLAGSTLTVALTLGTTADAYVTLMDRHGNYIDGNSSAAVTSATFNFTIAATGEYQLVVQADFSPYYVGFPASWTTDAVITSDDTMTVNPVAALYSKGASCYALLPCS